MRSLLLAGLLIATPLLAGPAEIAPSPDRQLAYARAEVARATAEEQSLLAEASRAGDEAQRLGDEQRAAAAAIAAAEARIDSATASLAMAERAEALQQRQLAARQAPAAALIAGLITMGRRPPLLSLANGSAEEFVRVRALLDATLPTIRARSAALSTDLAASRRTRLAAQGARDDLGRQRTALDQQRARFAELERSALARQSRLAGQAIGAGDATLADSEVLAVLGTQTARRNAALAAAREIAKLDPLPGRPQADDGRAPQPPFAYQLPAVAAVTAGIGSVDANGVRSRGLSLATWRGARLVVPADGKIAFAGPYRRGDGVIIVDHGGGWLSLLVNVATTLPVGTGVRGGEPLGTALGPVGVELYRQGTNVSPALMAASSATLSNRGEHG